MFLYGASGHGKVIKDILLSQNRVVDGFIDDNATVNELCGIPVVHNMYGVKEVIVSIGDNRIRKQVVEKIDCMFADAAIHRMAVVSDTAELGMGSVVMAGGIINADTKIGKHCIVNTGASVDHECKLEDYVHVAPHASLCGQVQVGEGTLIGVGASVIPCVKIGKWCKIGAGAAIVHDIPDNSVVVGVPGRVIKRM